MATTTDSYLAMVILKQYQHLHTLVWCGSERGWVGIESAESHGFRPVLKLENREAWRLAEQMKIRGFLNSGGMGSSEDLSIEVKRLSDRPIYAFYSWDSEEGAIFPLATIRASSKYQAERYFQEKHVAQWESTHQVRHIGECSSDWESISQLNLETDLICQGL